MSTPNLKMITYRKEKVINSPNRVVFEYVADEDNGSFYIIGGPEENTGEAIGFL